MQASKSPSVQRRKGWTSPTRDQLTHIVADVPIFNTQMNRHKLLQGKDTSPPPWVVLLGLFNFFGTNAWSRYRLRSTAVVDRHSQRAAWCPERLVSALMFLDT